MFKFLQETIKVLGRWALSSEKHNKIKSHWGNIDNCYMSTLR